jgi:hypothetical protein
MTRIEIKVFDGMVLRTIEKYKWYISNRDAKHWAQAVCRRELQPKYPCDLLYVDITIGGTKESYAYSKEKNELKAVSW